MPKKPKPDLPIVKGSKAKADAHTAARAKLAEILDRAARDLVEWDAIPAGEIQGKVKTRHGVYDLVLKARAK